MVCRPMNFATTSIATGSSCGRKFYQAIIVQVVRKVEIPKPQGGTRMLGIPTVIDRLLQQGIAQWLSPKYEEEFSDYSYGFREGRNAHQAVLQAQTNLNEGHEWVIELDLEKFFDKV